MKVAFKLTIEQLARAQEICAQTAEQNAKENQGFVFEPAEQTDWEFLPASYYNAVKSLRYYFRGNMLSYKVDQFDYNKDQNLSLEGSILTYTGQRCPLWVDGGSEVIKDIAGGDLDSLEVVEYESSDPDMLWHDTAYSYIRRTAVCPKTLLTKILRHSLMWRFLEDFRCFRIESVLKTVDSPEYLFNECDMEVFERGFVDCAREMIPGQEKAAKAWLKNRKARKQIYDFCVRTNQARSE